VSANEKRAVDGAKTLEVTLLGRSYRVACSDEEREALLQAVAQRFPAVTTVRVKDALDAVGALLGKLALGIRAASLITILSAVLVLGGALAAGHRHRVYDAVVLKTLGATRVRLLAAYALEYVLLGLATGLAAAGRAAGAAFVCATDLPLLHPAFVRCLVAALRAPAADPVDVVLPVVAGTWHPLAAAYRTGLAGEAQEAVLHLSLGRE